jgi:copper(I)-binding protein
MKDGDIIRMREVEGYDIPASGSYELKPNGSHLMLVDLKRPLKEGERIPVVLKFEKSGEVKVDFEVRPLVAPASSLHQH